jgi:uncharacterized protein YcbX
MASKNGRITDIFYYPVKSCRSIAASSVDITERGIKHDRIWVVASAEGKALTQREFSQMALIEAKVDAAGNLHLAAPERDSFAVAHGNGSNATTVDVWGNQCAGVDEGDVVADWLSSYLETQCRLVRMAENNDRQCMAPLPDGSPVKLTFVDGCSLLVISQASLDDLNNRLENPVPIARFRPNIVISGFDAFAEDDFDELKIGDITLYKVQQCERCVITTIDPQTAKKGVEPLKTLSTYRRVEKKVHFGAYYLHAQQGRINVGDEIIAS